MRQWYPMSDIFDILLNIIHQKVTEEKLNSKRKKCGEGNCIIQEKIKGRSKNIFKTYFKNCSICITDNKQKVVFPVV